MKQRLGIAPAGFRTPGGFTDGLADRPDLQAMLREAGLRLGQQPLPARTRSPRPAKRPAPRSTTSIVAAQAQAQPFVYPTAWSRCR